jgi:hypothetical protein
VESRILLCGVMVGAFVLTLAFLFWQDGLWRYGAAPAARAAPHPHNSLVSKGAVASNPLVPSSEAVTTPSAAAALAAAAIAPPEPAQSEPQSEPYSSPDADNGAMPAPRDRGAERGSRSR